MPRPTSARDLYALSDRGLRFAFYGRCSTEDQQDPAASRAWQLRRSNALIQPHGGTIVAEYFDIDHSRALPWKRRPRAAALLAALKDPDRGFDAVVIGEPARAFYGNQYGLTFPLFAHYNVPLWVPEVGGPVDPANEAHELVMVTFAGMSKAERNRIKIRVQTAMAALAEQEGRFLGGRPPYGYTLVDAGPHPHPGKASRGQRLRMLAPDPVTEPVVRRIFAEFLAGRGLFAIAEGLTRDGIPSPSAYDRARNQHRDGRAWAKSAIRAILINPRYTGRQVWNRQPREEVLLDVEDVALGHTTKQTWTDPERWVTSVAITHEALISDEDFALAQERLKTPSRPTVQKPRRSGNRYALRQRVCCGVCDRRMVGTWNNQEAYYRCMFPREYALANKVDHPRTVYLREALILPRLDEWIAGLFAPDRIEHTCQLLAEASRPEHAPGVAPAAVAAARQGLRHCDERLSQYRAALEAGTDARVVQGWVAEVQVERARHEELLRAARRRQEHGLTPFQVRNMLTELPDVETVLGDGSIEDRERLYAGLGVVLTYYPALREVLVEADPVTGTCTKGRVGGGT